MVTTGLLHWLSERVVKHASRRDTKSVVTFIALLEAAEEAQTNIQNKFLLTKIAFTGKPYEKGEAPYQTFALLISLRNALVHTKPLTGEINFTPGGDMQVAFKYIVQRLPKNILADGGDLEHKPNWVRAISTRAVARWACNAAAEPRSTESPNAPCSAYDSKTPYIRNWSGNFPQSPILKLSKSSGLRLYMRCRPWSMSSL
jgi:hypothetical protein